VMDVLAIGAQDRREAGHEHAPQDGEPHLHDRKAEREQRGQDDDGGRTLLQRLQRQDREDVAEEEAARVAEEDRSGIEVVAEEARERAAERRPEAGGVGASLAERDGEERRRRDQRDARGEAVEAVDQVEGVREADDPRDRDERAERAERNEAAGQRIRDAAEPVAARDRDRGGDDLEPELRERAEPAYVVED